MLPAHVWVDAGVAHNAVDRTYTAPVTADPLMVRGADVLSAIRIKRARETCSDAAFPQEG
jgi:hypothetical protein